MRSASATSLVSSVLAVFALLVGGCGGGGDLSTPKGAATAFAKAMERGDVEAAKAASTGADPEMLAAMVKTVSSMKKLQDAAVAKYGEEGKKLASENRDDLDITTAVENAEVKIEGDTATLTAKDKGEPLKLKKIGNEWKVDMSEMSGPAAGFGAIMMTAMSKAADELAGEIKAGKHKTVEEAQAAMSQKMMGAMMGAQKE